MTHLGISSSSTAIVVGQRQRRKGGDEIVFSDFAFQFLELFFIMESRPAALWFKVRKIEINLAIHRIDAEIK